MLTWDHEHAAGAECHFGEDEARRARHREAPPRQAKCAGARKACVRRRCRVTKIYYAGQDVDAPCGRCGGETRHQILTVTDGVPERLICGNCRSVHKFRMAKPEPMARTPRIATAAKSGGPRPGSLVNQFQQALAAEQGGAKAQ